MSREEFKDLILQALKEFTIQEVDDMYEEIVLEYMEKE